MALLATNIARISSTTRTRHPPPSPELMRQIMATRAALSQTMSPIPPAATTPTNNSNTTLATTKVSNMEVVPTRRTNQASTKGAQGRNRRDRSREAVRNQVISATIKGTSTRTQDASRRHRR